MDVLWYMHELRGELGALRPHYYATLSVQYWDRDILPWKQSRLEYADSVWVEMMGTTDNWALAGKAVYPPFRRLLTWPKHYRVDISPNPASTEGVNLLSVSSGRFFENVFSPLQSAGNSNLIFTGPAQHHAEPFGNDLVVAGPVGTSLCLLVFWDGVPMMSKIVEAWSNANFFFWDGPDSATE